MHFLSGDSVSADIKLETETENGSMEDIPAQLNANTYHPKHALKAAIRDWLPEFYKAKNAFGRSISVPLVPTPIPALPVISACFSTSAMATPTTSGRASPTLDSSFQPLSKELVNSLIIPKEIVNLEPMDCNPLPASPKHEEIVETSISVDSSPKCEEQTGTVVKDETAEEMQTEPVDASSENGDSEGKQLLESDVVLLIDLFYLPFEHGKQGLKILQEFHWLKSHGHLVCQNPRKKSAASETSEIQEWFSRASKFDAMTQAVGKLLMRITYCPNRSLLYNLYPYIWDIKGVISMLNSYLKWIGNHFFLT